MAKKVNTKTIPHNPLLIPLVITLILLAFLGGLSLNRNRNAQFEALQLQVTTSPIPTNIPTTSTNENTTNIKQLTRRAVVIPVSNKTVYCEEDGYDAVNNAIREFNDAMRSGDALLAEQDRCNNTCRDKMNEIIETCKSSSDEEACLKTCPNNCLKLVENRIKDVPNQIKERAGVINQVVAQFCTN